MLTSTSGGTALAGSDEGNTTSVKSPRQLFQERIRSILSAPMPRCLQSSSTYAMRSVARRNDAGASEGGEHDTTKDVTSASRYVSAVDQGAMPTSPRLPIYEQLLQKGRLMQEHRERLRQEAIEREVRELRPAPRVPAASSGLAADAAPHPTPRLPPEGQRIEDRLLRRAKAKAEQAAHAAQQRREREEEDLAAIATFHPHISAHAQATKARYKEPAVDRAAWRAARREELAQVRQVAELEELGELQSVPAINRTSARLAAEKKAREGLEGLPAPEAFAITEHRRRLAQWQAAEAERVARESASPSITRQAATMQRAGDVGSRLHAKSHDAAIRRLQREVAWREAHTPFQPEVTTLAAVTAPRYQRERSEAATRRGASTGRSRSALSRNASATPGASFQPSINPVSAAIADRLPETAMERLCRPSAVHSLSSYVDPAASLDTSALPPGQQTPRRATHTRLDAPSPPSLSASPPATTNTVQAPPPQPLPRAVAASLDAYERRRQARLEALRREQSAQELQECTFQPQVNARSAALVAEASLEANGAEERHGPRAVALRSDEWQLQRERHVETMRRWQEERAAAADAMETGRRGQRAPPVDVSSSAAPQSVYGGDGRAWGVDAYLARQQLARAQRQERQQHETLRHYDDEERRRSEISAAPVHQTSATDTPLRDYHWSTSSTIRSLRPPVSTSQALLSRHLWDA